MPVIDCRLFADITPGDSVSKWRSDRIGVNELLRMGRLIELLGGTDVDSKNIQVTIRDTARFAGDARIEMVVEVPGYDAVSFGMYIDHTAAPKYGAVLPIDVIVAHRGEVLTFTEDPKFDLLSLMGRYIHSMNAYVDVSIEDILDVIPGDEENHRLWTLVNLYKKDPDYEIMGCLTAHLGESNLEFEYYVTLVVSKKSNRLRCVGSPSYSDMFGLNQMKRDFVLKAPSFISGKGTNALVASEQVTKLMDIIQL